MKLLAIRPGRLSCAGRVLLASCLLVLLGACANDGMDDLRDFVENAHKGKTAKIEPLPEIKAQENFAYGAASLADPFASFQLKPQSANARGPRPDMNRRKEPLEDFPLDALKMVGTLTRGRRTCAVLQAPDGSVHCARVGNHLGQNFGAITRVAEDKISVVELIQGPMGDWIEREASVALAE